MENKIVTTSVKYPFQNFYEAIEKNAKHLKNKPIIFEDDIKISHIQLKEYVDSFAKYLELLGVGKDDKVAILMTNSKEFIISFLAIGKLGAVPVPINTFLKRNEIEYIIKNSDSKILITQEKFKDELKGILHSITSLKKIIWSGDVDSILDACRYDVFTEIFRKAQ
ncbi:MAG TPA: long-chain fatty acid--CoA ligase, partial [Hydrogenothermaceae bacterium]|nr:long-chain fatty acid--CoA ligase [Hydrogenothermaceae bacterium]